MPQLMPVPIPADEGAGGAAGVPGTMGVLDLLEAAWQHLLRKEQPAWRRAMRAAATGSPMQEHDLEELLDVATNFSTPLAGIVAPARMLLKNTPSSAVKAVPRGRLPIAGNLVELLPTDDIMQALGAALADLYTKGASKLPLLRHFAGPQGHPLSELVPFAAADLGPLSAMAVPPQIHPPAGAIAVNLDLLRHRYGSDIEQLASKMASAAIHEAQHIAAMHGWPRVVGLHGWSPTASITDARAVAKRPGNVLRAVQGARPVDFNAILYRTNLGELLASEAEGRWARGLEYMLQHPIDPLWRTGGVWWF